MRLFHLAALIAVFTLPAAAAPLGNIVQVTAGYRHTCALDVAGSVYCWGLNDHGQLGLGDTLSRSTPALVPGLTEVKSISAGAYHTCAMYGFISNSNYSVACWGANDTGQIGDSTVDDRYSPVTVVQADINHGAIGVSAGDFHTCAIFRPGNVMECWGNNGSGQLGDGTNLAHTSPTPSFPTAGAVSAGGFHTCAASSVLVCWGNNFSGALGDGTRTSRNRGSFDSPAQLPNTPGWVSAGTYHTCATVAGAVLCWGSNIYGQLGNGSTADQLVPTQVTGLASGYFNVEAGGRHSCALGPSGTAKCWGANDFGQLGEGTTNPQTGVVSVYGIAGATSLAAGDNHSCAVMGDRTVKCWGDNTHGQIGTGVAGNPQAYPTTVGSLTPQSLTFGPLPPRDVNTAPVGLSATATSGLAPVFASKTPSVCTVSGTNVTMVAIGICAVTANQPGDNTYTSAGTVVRSFMVSGSLPSYPTRLANLSTRVRVGVGDDVAIAGFVIGGNSEKQVILRARGPSLGAAGITNPLADPVLKLYKGPLLLALNDNWQADGRADIIQEIGFAPGDPRESALLMTLQPGAYTVIVGNTAFVGGVAIVEVWEVDNVASPLMNLSTRGQVLGGEEVMIAGMIIHGPNPNFVAINVAGPSLSKVGILTPLMNPTLTLVRASDNTIVGQNDDWDACEIAISRFRPKDAKEPAMLMQLAPGAYTAIVHGVAGTGIALVGIFDAGAYPPDGLCLSGG